MSFSRRTLSITTVLIVLSLLGGGIWWRLRPADGEDGGEAEASVTDTVDVDLSAASQEFSASIPQPVEGAEVIRDTLWVSVTASGKAEAFRRTPVQAQVEGVIQSVPVRENSRVARGQTLLQIDSTELALAVAQARTDLLTARAEFQALMIGGGGIEDPELKKEREEYARAQSGLAKAEVTLRQEELRLERSTVRAPFEGRIADLNVVPGQHVTAGTELMTVVDLDPIKVQIEVLEKEVAKLREGRRARVTFAAFPDETFTGRIETINPVVNPQESTARVTVHIPNPSGRIKPGMYANASLEAEYYPDRVLVPRSAILERDGRTMLFVYEEEGGEGASMWRYVTTGRQNETLVEIVPSDEGMVESGEIVLVDGHHYLAHDTPVRLVENVTVEGGRPGG